MPFRSVVILCLCALAVGVAAVAGSRTYGPHHYLEERIDEILESDEDDGDVGRNLSPYCFLGSCPKVSKRTRFSGSVREVESAVLDGLRRHQYSAAFGGAGWRTYVRNDATIRYRIGRSEDGGATLYWEAQGV